MSTANGDNVATSSDAALAAMQRGDFALGAQLFEQAARAHLAAGEASKAFTAFSNLAMARKLGGDLRGALAATEEALAMATEPDARRFTLMTRGSILDALDDERAAPAWTEAAAQHADHAAAAFCLAHAAGASLKHGKPGALDGARRALAGSGQPSRSQVVGIVGAVGESAGSAGVPMLAQAVLVMTNDPTTFNPSTAAFWELLVERIGLVQPIVLPLAAFGLLLTTLRNGQPDHAVLLSRVSAVFHRVAHARGISTDQLLDTVVERFSTPQGSFHGSVLLPVLEPGLRALIPAECWLVRV